MPFRRTHVADAAMSAPGSDALRARLRDSCLHYLSVPEHEWRGQQYSFRKLLNHKHETVSFCRTVAGPGRYEGHRSHAFLLSHNYVFVEYREVVHRNDRGRIHLYAFRSVRALREAMGEALAASVLET